MREGDGIVPIVAPGVWRNRPPGCVAALSSQSTGTWWIQRDSYSIRSELLASSVVCRTLSVSGSLTASVREPGYTCKWTSTWSLLCTKE